MREVPGSNPGSSHRFFSILLYTHPTSWLSIELVPSGRLFLYYLITITCYLLVSVWGIKVAISSYFVGLTI